MVESLFKPLTAVGTSIPIKIIAEHVVNAAGLWARKLDAWWGWNCQFLPWSMYLLTEDMPEVAEINASTGAEVLHAVDFDGEIYLRQERQGMLMGTYEKACKPTETTHHGNLGTSF